MCMWECEPLQPAIHLCLSDFFFNDVLIIWFVVMAAGKGESCLSSTSGAVEEAEAAWQRPGAATALATFAETQPWSE